MQANLPTALNTRFGWFPPSPEKLTKALITEMKRYAESHNARFLLIYRHWKKVKDHDMVRDLTAVDVLDLLTKAPPEWNTMVIPGDGHPDARGGKYVSALLRDYFMSRGWWN